MKRPRFLRDRSHRPRAAGPAVMPLDMVRERFIVDACLISTISRDDAAALANEVDLAASVAGCPRRMLFELALEQLRHGQEPAAVRTKVQILAGVSYAAVSRWLP